MAARESLVALLEDEDDDHFEERISGRLSFLVEEATKLSFELDKMKGNFDIANEAPANGLEPNKPMTVQNINDKLKSVQAKLELAEKCSTTPNNAQVRQVNPVPRQFDVSSWPYPKLRDMINISSDIDLLMACHAEIERRVAVRKAEQERLAKRTSNARSDQVTYNRMPIWKQDEHSDATRHLAGWWYFQYDGDLKIMRQFKIFHPDLEELDRIAGGHWQTMVNQSDISHQDFESAWTYYQQNISIQGTQL